jgi:hypothetical protein
MAKTEVQNNLLYLLYGGSGGSISCDFDGYTTVSGRHEGIDCVKSEGSDIYAISSGTIISVTRPASSSSTSTLFVYDSTNDKTVCYMHSNFDSNLAVGQTITAGTHIGTEGANGNVTGPHTHVEVLNGKRAYASKSVNDSTLDNSDPYTTYWNGLLSNGVTGVTFTDSSGSSSSTSINLDDGIEVSDWSVDDSFTQSYLISNPTEEEYTNNLSSSLRITDIRGILGVPHQFLPSADARISTASGAGDVGDLGRVYTDKIIKQIPLLLITPGTPQFMAGYSKDQKATAIANLFPDGGTEDDLDSLVNDTSGKYYTLKFAYTDYYEYLNEMLRSAAILLEIEDFEIESGKKLGSYNWMNHTTSGGDDTETTIFGSSGLSAFLGPYAGCIAAYADCGNTVDDSFRNDTSNSQLASAINSLSDQGRELNFLIGNVGGQAGLKLDALAGGLGVDAAVSTVADGIDSLLGNNNIFSNILNKTSTILAGGRMVFPKIWSESSFSRSYGVKMKLVSPSGDKVSVFLNILVPIYHILALTLPRQSEGQTYFSPFLVRAYSKSLFNVDMGLITNLSISKGAEGEWTQDGLPTVADVSFDIEDLYDNMFMSSAAAQGTFTGIMSNITELDYIANSCGVNINDHEIARTIQLYTALTAGSIKDRIQIGIFGKIQQWCSQKIQNIFGVFS